MGITNNRWLIALALISVLFATTACLRVVGDDAGGPQTSLVVSPTNTPPPTVTPEPTEEPTQTTTVADLPISNFPTDTATPTETEVVEVAQAGDEGLQATQPPDTFSLTATQLILESTMTAVAPFTQTAAALIGSTDTPTATTEATLDLGTTGTTFGGDCVHEVRAGDTMFALSMYYGIPVNDIATRNGVVNPNIIGLGQRLIINGCGTTGAFPPPTSVPTATLTPFQLPGTFGTGGTDLGDPSLGQGGGATNVGCVAQYTVQQYDTLFQISINYGVAVQSLANANGIVNINRINMGDVLCIPAQ